MVALLLALVVIPMVVIVSALVIGLRRDRREAALRRAAVVPGRDALLATQAWVGSLTANQRLAHLEERVRRLEILADERGRQHLP